MSSSSISIPPVSRLEEPIAKAVLEIKPEDMVPVGVVLGSGVYIIDSCIMAVEFQKGIFYLYINAGKKVFIFL